VLPCLKAVVRGITTNKIKFKDPISYKLTKETIDSFGL
jgi:hypothetical protein